MLSEIGLTVARSIPAQFLPGLATGALQVNGGVIRNGLGQIVCHLASPGVLSSVTSLVPGLDVIASLVNSGQIYAVRQNVKRVQETLGTVLSMSTAATALSGLGVVTSVAGFAYLSQRLNVIDVKLAEIEKQVKEIGQLIHSQQKAQLLTAIDYLRQAEQTGDPKMRHDLLMQSKDKFSVLSHYYKDVWADSKEIHKIEGVDEYFTLAFTGASISSSELGMADVAAAELSRHYSEWKILARQHCAKQLLRTDPQRLLDAAFVADLPTKLLIETLDFANDSDRGIEWIDELRRQPNAFKIPKVTLPGSWQPFSQASEKPSIDLTKKLLARNAVLSANESQFQFLQEKKLSSSQFSKAIQSTSNAHGDVPICIVAA